MKKTKKILLIAFLLFVLGIMYLYTCAIDAIPASTILFQGEEFNVKTLFGMSLVNKNEEYQSILTSISVET